MHVTRSIEYFFAVRTWQSEVWTKCALQSRSTWIRTKTIRTGRRSSGKKARTSTAMSATRICPLLAVTSTLCWLTRHGKIRLGGLVHISYTLHRRIRGGQHTSDEKTMFNNSNFALQYNTMANEEIMDLDVGSLSKRGFIFLWTINSQFQFAFECLNRWGYNYVDRVSKPLPSSSRC